MKKHFVFIALLVIIMSVISPVAYASNTAYDFRNNEQTGSLVTFRIYMFQYHYMDSYKGRIILSPTTTNDRDTAEFDVSRKRVDIEIYRDDGWEGCAWLDAGWYYIESATVNAWQINSQTEKRFFYVKPNTEMLVYVSSVDEAHMHQVRHPYRLEIYGKEWPAFAIWNSTKDNKPVSTIQTWRSEGFPDDPKDIEQEGERPIEKYVEEEWRDTDGGDPLPQDEPKEKEPDKKTEQDVIEDHEKDKEDEKDDPAVDNPDKEQDEKEVPENNRSADIGSYIFYALLGAIVIGGVIFLLIKKKK